MPSEHSLDASSAERIGLVYRSGRPDHSAWSRIPDGLARGFRELGFTAFLIDAEPRRTVARLAKGWALLARGNRHGGLFAPEVRELRRVTARRRAAGLEPLGSVVQMGSDFGIPFPQNHVTYEDTTVLQRVRVDAIDATIGAAAVNTWVAAQRKCYEAAVGCCAMSGWAADSIVTEYGIPRDKVHVVWAGRNCEPRPVDRDWTRPRFLFVGFDWERKNGGLVVRAFSHLRERFPNARLDVAGGHPPISIDGVVTHGPLDFSDSRGRSKAERLFESATCFVMPSHFEPFGIVYAEAAAAGVPSIGTDVGGAGDAIGPTGGLLVTPGDERMLVDAMIKMCNPDRVAAMGAAALERSPLFTWKVVAERVGRALGLVEDQPRVAQAAARR
jgi:glycosyltransferase involved in cell wall biosynthesis